MGIENTMGNGDNSGCQHVLLFPVCSENSSFYVRMNSMVGGKEPCGKKKTVGNTVGKKQNTDDWH